MENGVGVGNAHISAFGTIIVATNTAKKVNYENLFQFGLCFQMITVQVHNEWCPLNSFATFCEQCKELLMRLKHYLVYVKGSVIGTKSNYHLSTVDKGNSIDYVNEA